ncbi:MAG: PBSX family phage terminase large subunit [Oscillospiraceae bacterium]
MSKTLFKTFSQKQLKLLTWWLDGTKTAKYDAIICDGAVRSGKTVCMSISFVAWAFYGFSDSSFAICGKTIASIRRNVITVLIPILTDLGFTCEEKLSKNYIEIKKGNRKNRFYIFGGRDESSASLIQGMTLSGIMLDEVALMPRSFVEQALARCSVSGSKFWFNCNPESPMHWFYNEWIKKSSSKNCFYLHFKMEDNPSLSKSIIKRYKSLYSGAFYERFIEGKWVAADGLVYPFFGERMITPPPKCFDRFYISCDYGTVNPTSMGLWGESGGEFYRIDEFYHSSKAEGFQMTDEEYYCSLCTLASDKNIELIVVDPSAASFIECINRHAKFTVKRADNDVIGGIRKTSDALKSGKIKICSPCKDIIREFSLYRWDEGAKNDCPKKENDHAMDDMRYFVSTVLKEESDFFAITMERR